MNCPRCGTSNHDNLANCVRCGAVLVASSDANTFVGVSLPPTPAAVKPAAVVGAPAPAIAAMTPPPDASNAQTAGGWAVIGSAPSTDQVNFGPRYRIDRLLGQGGMGAVYKAWDKELERPVALKLIRPELSLDPTVEQRFKQELLLASKISHKNILRIHDLGEAGGVKFISMAFVEGEDLHQLLIRHGKLPVDHALKITKQLCSALDAAHSEGVVHRDFKPQNILLDKQENVHVSDFGLAKSLESDHSMTKSGEFLGTPRYMAPEQVQGGKIDHRADLYALGLILYEMVTGDVPFHADTTLQLMYKRVHEVPKSPKTLNPELPDWLVRVIMKCIDCDPDKRYQTAGEILHDLETGTAPKSRSGSVQIALPSFGFELNRIWLVIAAAVLLVVGLLAIPSVRYRIIGGGAESSGPHKPLTVLVGDFANHTGDPVLDGTLEPMFNAALEGASFINGFNRGTARKLARQLPNPTDKLDEQSARLVASGQAVSAVITGEISLRGDKYTVSATVLDAITGKVIAQAAVDTPTKDDIVQQLPKLAAPIRKALGDTTPESVQLTAAAGTLNAASLEAVHQYSQGMEYQFTGKTEEALKSFARAAELDPNFARAYSGMAAASATLQRPESAEKYLKLALQHVDRMTERERYRTRGLYYYSIGDFPKCVEEYTSLLDRYPVDNIAHANLANCYSELRNMPKAVEQVRRALELSPSSLLWRSNYAMASDLAGDFQTAEREARAVQQANPSLEIAYLALAFAQTGQGRVSEAADTYKKLSNISELGASYAASGLSDLALYEGRFAEAAQILEVHAAAELKVKDSRAPEHLVALAYTYLAAGRNRAAVQAAERALRASKKVNIRFLAARVLAAAGQTKRAQEESARLANELPPDPRASAKLIEAEIALQKKDAHTAIRLVLEANKVLDTWIGRFDLGRAYLEAGLFAEADSEFDRCFKRQGEALELDDGPTFGYFPPVYYYQGRVREGLKSPGFADSYRMYLSIRGKAGEDPLLAEIHRRLGQ